MQYINKAWNVLKDITTRKKYDENLITRKEIDDFNYLGKHKQFFIKLLVPYGYTCSIYDHQDSLIETFKNFYILFFDAYPKGFRDPDYYHCVHNIDTYPTGFIDQGYHDDVHNIDLINDNDHDAEINQSHSEHDQMIDN